MDDKLLMENYLLLLKSTTEVFVHGTLEASSEKVRNVLKESLGKILDCQNRCYNEMVKNSWYVVENVNVSEIAKTLNKVLSS